MGIRLSRMLLILLLVVVVFGLLSSKTTATVGQPIPSCASLVQATNASCSIDDGILHRVSVSFPLQPSGPVMYVQDLPSGKLYHLLPTDATTAQTMSQIPDYSQVMVLGLLTIPPASADPTYTFAGDIAVQVIAQSSPNAEVSYTMITVSTSAGSVVTVTPQTYTIVATIAGGQTTMVETVTGGTYTLTGTQSLAGSPSIPTTIPPQLEPVVKVVTGFWNWLRCLFGFC